MTIPAGTLPVAVTFAVRVTLIPAPALLFEELRVVTEVADAATTVSVALCVTVAGVPSESDTMYSRVKVPGVTGPVEYRTPAGVAPNSWVT